METGYNTKWTVPLGKTSTVDLWDNLCSDSQTPGGNRGVKRGPKEWTWWCHHHSNTEIREGPSIWEGSGFWIEAHVCNKLWNLGSVFAFLQVHRNVFLSAFIYQTNSTQWQSEVGLGLATWVGDTKPWASHGSSSYGPTWVICDP